MKSLNREPRLRLSRRFGATVLCALAAIPGFAQPAEKEQPATDRVSSVSAGMALPESLKSGVVVLRQSRVRSAWPKFPPYSMNVPIELGWEEMWNLFDVTVETDTAPGSFGFTVSEDQTEKLRVACRSKSPGEDWPATVRRDSQPHMLPGILPAYASNQRGELRTFQCYLLPKGSDQRWSFDFETSGRLTNGTVTYEVTPASSHQSAKVLKGLGKFFGTPVSTAFLTDYLFTVDQKPVAAVTREHAGRLILHNSIAPEDRAFIVAAAIIILRQ